jgi:predicted transcriptional regulator
MPPRGFTIPEYEDQILMAVTSVPQKTPEVIRAIPGDLRNHKTTAENYLHRMAVQGKVTREKVPAPWLRNGYYFMWKKAEAASERVGKVAKK